MTVNLCLRNRAALDSLVEKLEERFATAERSKESTVLSVSVAFHLQKGQCYGFDPTIPQRVDISLTTEG